MKPRSKGGGRGRSKNLIIDVEIFLMWIGVGVNVCAHDDRTSRAQRVGQATSTRGRCVQESGSELGGFRR